MFMILTIPFSELASHLEPATEFTHFQRTTAMAIALDHFFRHTQSLDFKKKIETSVDRLGFSGQKTHVSYPALLERIERKITILERLIRPMLKTLELDDVEDLPLYMAFKVNRCLPQGWIVGFEVTPKGKRFIEINAGGR